MRSPTTRHGDVDFSWRTAAACAGEPLVLFYGPERELPAAREARERKVKALCSQCPVRTECGEYAITRPEKHGTWGGLTAEERVSARRKWLRSGRAA